MLRRLPLPFAVKHQRDVRVAGFEFGYIMLLHNPIKREGNHLHEVADDLLKLAFQFLDNEERRVAAVGHAAREIRNRHIEFA